MAEIDVTEYRLPRGERIEQRCYVTDEAGALAQELTEAGYTFGFEVLRTGDASATLEDGVRGRDAWITLMSRAQAETIFARKELPTTYIFNTLITAAHAQWILAGKPKAGSEWQAQQENEARPL